MLPKLRRITAVLTAALSFAAATIPVTSAQAQGYYGPGYVRAGGWYGGRGAWGNAGYGYGYGGGGCGCCCQVYVPPPPPPPPPCCCCGGGGYYRGGYGYGGYGGYGGDGYGGW
jgi:hypothetical protein